MDLTSLCKGVRDVAWDNPALWSGTATSVANSAGTVTVQAAQAVRKNVLPEEAYSFNIAVNAAINAIKSQFGKASGRLFNRGGEEVVGGEAWEVLQRPAPGLSYQRWIEEIVAWYNIRGEFAVRVGQYDAGQFPRSLSPLCPSMLEVERPLNPRTPADVVQWRYVYADGTTEYIRGDYLAFDRLFNPNPYSIRGLSPLTVGAVQIGSQIAAEVYNKSFFDNGGVPSHLIVLPDGVPMQHRKDFESRYLAEYGRYNSNSHKVMVVAGKDVKVESLEEPFQDGAFLEMMKRGDLKVGQLYRVPAINMGIYDKTRFDTANEERKLFLEETLMPQAAAISATIQTQIIDRHFRGSRVTVKRPRMTKALGQCFEKALADRPDSGLVFLIDPDTLPVSHEVMLARAEMIQQLRESAMISPRAACEFVHLDVEDDREERNEIWASGTNIVCITKPELNAQLTPGVGAGPNGKNPTAGSGAVAGKPPAKKPAAKKELSTDDRNRFSQAKRTLFDLRKLALSKMGDGDLFGLSDGDALNTGQDKAVWAEIRAARHALRKICEDGGLDRAAKVEAAKDWFGKYKPPYLRKMLGL